MSNSVSNQSLQWYNTNKFIIHSFADIVSSKDVFDEMVNYSMVNTIHIESKYMDQFLEYLHPLKSLKDLHIIDCKSLAILNRIPNNIRKITIYLVSIDKEQLPDLYLPNTELTICFENPINDYGKILPFKNVQVKKLVGITIISEVTIKKLYRDIVKHAQLFKKFRWIFKISMLTKKEKGSGVTRDNKEILDFLTQNFIIEQFYFVDKITPFDMSYCIDNGIIPVQFDFYRFTGFSHPTQLKKSDFHYDDNCWLYTMFKNNKFYLNIILKNEPTDDFFKCIVHFISNYEIHYVIIKPGYFTHTDSICKLLKLLDTYDSNIKKVMIYFLKYPEKKKIRQQIYETGCYTYVGDAIFDDRKVMTIKKSLCSNDIFPDFKYDKGDLIFNVRAGRTWRGIESDILKSLDVKSLDTTDSPSMFDSKNKITNRPTINYFKNFIIKRFILQNSWYPGIPFYPKPDIKIINFYNVYKLTHLFSEKDSNAAILLLLPIELVFTIIDCYYLQKYVLDS